MAHHYQCCECGNYIDYTESFCYSIKPETKEQEKAFKEQLFGGYGYGVCGECLSNLDTTVEDYYNKKGGA